MNLLRFGTILRVYCKLFINETPTKRVSKIKYLDIKVDCDLKWIFIEKVYPIDMYTQRSRKLTNIQIYYECLKNLCLE